MQELFPLLQTTVVVICQQMIALDDLGGGMAAVLWGAAYACSA